MESPSIPRSVAAQLGFYVYLYVDPRDDRVSHVGKGKGARPVAHIGDEKTTGSRSHKRAIHADTPPTRRAPGPHAWPRLL
jgi:hypothetical protein